MATAKKPKVVEPKGYCTTAVLADLFDTTGQWIGELTRNGIIQKQETSAGPRYDIRETVRSYVRHLRERAAGRDKDEKESNLEGQKLAAEVRLKEAKASYAELELQELEGIMHRSEDVEHMTEQLIFSIRSMILALPGRLAVDVAAENDAAKASVIIRRETNAILAELTNFKYDPAAYAKLVAERQKWTDANTDEEV